MSKLVLLAVVIISATCATFQPQAIKIKKKNPKKFLIFSKRSSPYISGWLLTKPENRKITL